MTMDTDAATAQHERLSGSGLEFKLHPLVLINVSDHYTRTRANSPDSVAAGVAVYGFLLGTQVGRTVDISNSFEIKYDRDAQGVVQMDMPFTLHKQEQYKQVFPKLDVVGWYATGAELRPELLGINSTVTTIVDSPVLMLLSPIIDHARKDLPVVLYETELHIVDDQSVTQFVKTTYTVETSDAERIGVDQVAKLTASGRATGSEQLTSHLTGLQSATNMLSQRVQLVVSQLQRMRSGEEPVQPALLRKISSLVSGLPAMDHAQFHKEYTQEYDDTLLVVMLAAMTKGVAGTNDLVDKCMIAWGTKGTRAGGTRG